MKITRNAGFSIPPEFMQFVTARYTGMYRGVIDKGLAKKSKWPNILSEVKIGVIYDVPMHSCIPDYPDAKATFPLILELKGAKHFDGGDQHLNDSLGYVTRGVITGKSTGLEEDAVILCMRLIPDFAFPDLRTIYHELHHVVQLVNVIFGKKPQNWGFAVKKPEKSEGADIDDSFEFYPYISGFTQDIVVASWEDYTNLRNNKKHGWEFLVSIHKENLRDFANWFNEKGLQEKTKRKALKVIAHDSYDQLLLLARRGRLAGVPS